MTTNRVIQDSDDDDPLACEAQPPPPVDTTIRQGNSNPTEGLDQGALDISSAVNGDGGGTGESQDEIGQDANGTIDDYGAGQINVNFVHFLQSRSQSQGQQVVGQTVSPSQQRREERWIPSGSGITRGSGSIGKACRAMFSLDDVVASGTDR